MNKYTLAALLSLAIARLASAQVQTDLILGFRDNGTDSGTTTDNLTVDLGSFTNFESGSSASYYVPGTTESTGVNIGSLLSSTFGSGYATDTGLLFGIVGADSLGNTFMSAAATGSSLNGTAHSTAWPVGDTTHLANPYSKFQTVQSHDGTGSLGGTDVVATTVTTSWSSVEQLTASKVWNGPNPGYLATTFEQTVPNAASDLYFLQATDNGGSGTAKFLGTFSITSGGVIDFTAASAIPEPSTYAAILGLLAVGFVLIRRHSRPAVLNTMA